MNMVHSTPYLIQIRCQPVNYSKAETVPLDILLTQKTRNSQPIHDLPLHVPSTYTYPIIQCHHQQPKFISAPSAQQTNRFR